MNHTLRDWAGVMVRASDGDIGTVEHLYFDDLTWGIRYLSVHTKAGGPARQALFAVAALSKPDWTKRVVPVDLTVAQVRRMPRRGADETVSREHEHELHKHFSWPIYWAGGFYVPSAYTLANAALHESEAEAKAVTTTAHAINPHLRGTFELLDARVYVADGNIGRVEDLVVDDDTCSIRYFVVNTRKWLAERRILVSPRWIMKVDWAEREVFVDLTQEAIKGSPVFEPSKPLSLDDESRLLDHLQKPETAEWVVFKHHAPPGASVHVAGTFNGWDTSAISLGENGKGLYTATVLLPLGRHEYKFIVNGEWVNGPECSEQSPNPFGTTNNVVVVARTAASRVHLHTFARQPHEEDRPMWYSPTLAASG